MADVADLAQERDELIREAALAAFRNRPRLTGESAHVCHCCGDPIDEGRRQAARPTKLCTFCAGQANRGK